MLLECGPNLALPQEKKKGFSWVKQLRGHQAIPHHPMKAIFIGISCSYVWFNNLQLKLRSFFNYQLAQKNCVIFAIARSVGSLTLQTSTLKCGRGGRDDKFWVAWRFEDFQGQGMQTNKSVPKKNKKKQLAPAKKKGCKHFLKGEIHLQIP